MGKKGRPNKYFTEEERKEAKREYGKQWRQEHKEEIAEYKKQYRQEHKEEIDEYNKQWRESNPEYQKQYNKTPMGRASYLLQAYKHLDKEAGRGECTLTAEWIMENIFPKPCHWCGETGWEIMGCDRIDNSLPHTPDNVNPCCSACNLKRGKKTYDEYKNALRAKETTL